MVKSSKFAGANGAGANGAGANGAVVKGVGTNGAGADGKAMVLILTVVEGLLDGAPQCSAVQYCCCI